VLPEHDDRPENKGGRALAYALLGLAVLAVFVIAAVVGKSLFDSSNPKMTKVTDVQGMTVDQATRALQRDNLTVAKITEENNDTQPKGKIFDQSPEPGNEVEQGDGVSLSVSLGKEEATVPNVVDFDLETAVQQLEDAGLKVGERKSVASDQDRNTVVKSTPKAGKVVPVGSVVDLEVASGQNKVPDVTGDTEVEARNKLEQAGFTVGTPQSQETTDPNAVGKVVAQTPKGGDNQRLGSTVTITIGTAPAVPPVSPPATPVTPPA
jgi:serine/threonine-protein kinase